MRPISFLRCRSNLPIHPSTRGSGFWELKKANRKRNKKTLFEALEDIEILRFIELGHVVKLIKMSSLSHPVDTVRDLKIVKKLIRK